MPCARPSKSGTERPARKHARDDHAPARPDRAARAPDAALAAAADLVPRVLPPPLRRRVQRALLRLPDADGDGVAPRRDPGAVRRARALAASRAGRRAAADRRAAVAAAARGARAPRAAPVDAAAVPRR